MSLNINIKYRFLILIVLLSACNKTDLDFPYEKNLTIEAFIEEGKQAKVYLTYNFPIDELVDSTALINSIETKAKVTLNNNGVEEILILKRDNSHYPMLFYQSDNIIGRVGESYQLSVLASEKNHYSETSVPSKHNIKEINFSTISEEKPNEKRLFINIDNPNPSQVTYFSLLIRNPKDSDKFLLTNRGLFTNKAISDTIFSVYVDYPKNYQDDSFILGDTIYLKLQSITENEYNFWKSINGDVSQLINLKGFDESVHSNFESAFGFFGGRNVSSYKVVVNE